MSSATPSPHAPPVPVSETHASRPGFCVRSPVAAPAGIVPPTSNSDHAISVARMTFDIALHPVWCDDRPHSLRRERRNLPATIVLSAGNVPHVGVYGRYSVGASA